LRDEVGQSQPFAELFLIAIDLQAHEFNVTQTEVVITRVSFGSAMSGSSC
jgi:hypothetical protein